MAKTPVIVASLVIVVMFLVETVGLATPHWMDIKGLDLHFGVFQICLSKNCFNFIGYVGFSIHYLGFAACQTIGSILILATAISGIVGATYSKKPEKFIIKNLAALSFTSAFFILASVTWFALSFYNNIDTLYNLYTYEPVTLGYSFVLSTVSGIGMLLVAIVCFSIAQNMSPPPVVAQAPQPGGQPMVVMATTNQQILYQHPIGHQPMTTQHQGQPYGQQPIAAQQITYGQGNLTVQPAYLDSQIVGSPLGQPGYGPSGGAPPGCPPEYLPPPAYSGQPSASGVYGPPVPNSALPGSWNDKPPLH